MSDTATGQQESGAGQTQSAGWLMLAVLALAQFMVILDITVVNVALPEIGRSLHLDNEALPWVIAAYTVTFGGLLILGGRLADAIGRKTTFLAGLALFTAASLVAGMADSGNMLLAGRTGQGVGAALLSPAALSILTTEFTGKARNRALGLWAAIGAAGAAVGVMVGGALTSGPGWEWAFYINVPVGLVVAAAVPVIVPTRPRQTGTRVDIPGALTGTAAVALVIYGLIKAGESGWTSASALGPIVAGLLIGVAFVLIERRVAAPLVPRRLVTRPPLPGAVVVSMIATAVLFGGGFFLSSIYLQHVERYSALRAGLVFLPVAIATMVGAHLAVGHVTKVGPRVIASAGMTAGAVGLALMAWLGVGGGVPTALLPPFLLAGVGLGAAFVAAITSGLSSVEQEHAGVASGVFNTGHELGASLGVAVVSSVAAASIVTGGHAATLTGFQNAYLTAAVGALVLAVAALVLLPRNPVTPPADGPMFLH